MTMSPAWRTSTYSDCMQCVEVAELDSERVGVRDSKDPNGPVLYVSKSAMGAFLAGAKAGEFDQWA